LLPLILNLSNLIEIKNLSILSSIMMISVSILMVSNIPFAKKTFLNRMKKFNALIVLSIILISILTHIEIGSFVLFYSYLFFAIGKHVFIKYKAAQKVSL